MDGPEHPFKRARLHYGNEDLSDARAQSKQRMKSALEGVFEKYSKDFSGIGDEVDLETGEIIVDNGHIFGMDGDADPGSERVSTYSDDDDDDDDGYSSEGLSVEDERNYSHANSFVVSKADRPIRHGHRRFDATQRPDTASRAGTSPRSRQKLRTDLTKQLGRRLAEDIANALSDRGVTASPDSHKDSAPAQTQQPVKRSHGSLGGPRGPEFLLPPLSDSEPSSPETSSGQGQARSFWKLPEESPKASRTLSNGSSHRPHRLQERKPLETRSTSIWAPEPSPPVPGVRRRQTNNWKPWTKKEVESLVEMREKNIPWDTIHDSLPHRSLRAIVCRHQRALDDLEFKGALFRPDADLAAQNDVTPSAIRGASREATPSRQKQQHLRSDGAEIAQPSLLETGARRFLNGNAQSPSLKPKSAMLTRGSVDGRMTTPNATTNTVKHSERARLAPPSTPDSRARPASPAPLSATQKGKQRASVDMVNDSSEDELA